MAAAAGALSGLSGDACAAGGGVLFAPLLVPARRLAREGLPVSPSLARESAGLDLNLRARAFGSAQPLIARRRLCLPGLARVLDDVATGGRAAFYEGAAGRDLVALSAGKFTARDLAQCQAEWVDACRLRSWARCGGSRPTRRAT